MLRHPPIPLFRNYVNKKKFPITKTSVTRILLGVRYLQCFLNYNQITLARYLPACFQDLTVENSNVSNVNTNNLCMNTNTK